MKMILAAASLLALPLAPALAQGAPITASVKGPDGADHGTVTFTQTPTGVLVAADLKGLPDGAHGYHVHETGLCEGAFESAGAHYNPGGKAHGFKAEGGAHAGDMGNFSAVGGGAMFDMINPDLTLAGGTAPLNDADGSSVVIHASGDDYASQPAGKSGDRIACGVIYAKP